MQDLFCCLWCDVLDQMIGLDPPVTEVVAQQDTVRVQVVSAMTISCMFGQKTGFQLEGLVLSRGPMKSLLLWPMQSIQGSKNHGLSAMHQIGLPSPVTVFLIWCWSNPRIGSWVSMKRLSGPHGGPELCSQFNP